MKRLFLLFCLLPCLVFGQADPKRFQDGVTGMLGTPFDFPSLVLEGKTHLGRVCRVNAMYPGGGLPPVMSIDKPAIIADAKAWFRAGGKGYILRVEGTRQENSALYKGDFDRFDAAYTQAVEVAKQFPSTRFIVHIAAGEPAFTVDAYAEMPGASNKEVYTRAEAVKQTWLDHLIPFIRAQYPNLTLILPGCSYSTSYGGINDLMVWTKRPPGNCYIGFDEYWPRRYSHNDGVSYKVLDLLWPEPLFKEKILAAGEDYNSYNYQNGYKTVDEVGMGQEIDNALLMVTTLGAKAFVTEYGTPAPNRRRSQDFILKKRDEYRKRGVPTTEWRG